MVLVEEATKLIGKDVSVQQLLSGREVANDVRGNRVHQFAYQMANYMYVVCDEQTREAIAVDPCWDVDGVLRVCENDLKVTIKAAVWTHRHFDHTGGVVPRAMTGTREDIVLPGIADFVERGIACYVGREDAKAVSKQARVPLDKIHALDEGDTVPLNERFKLQVLATPGHTPGSVCFLLAPDAETPGVLFTGDTLFIMSCGRTDLPESNVSSMLKSLTRLSALPGGTIVLPGHNYALPAHSTISEERDTNAMMMQAMERFQQSGSGTLTSEPVAALLPLPDYLGVARKLYDDHLACEAPSQNAAQLLSKP
ncbi:Hydroxyacylglutathione hydrolase, mitochondrial [Hondaea fermentalgiana]|uniref:Hydroxyacylglutathione hydrolase, mitochondrial n=1 Tax=Hondaea fermentalgiana TaxID=2315210 RepID=A0A2R5G6K4_9STRA|nr:Hydroxyacylglutathione hydrolase, mitochondrial [Hondaea fermentalgiana]|eukprot:GBG26687.1 Hydroxyacylglutathione hydrolase, mitochondrial [Hondaea fermentalgiana]